MGCRPARYADAVQLVVDLPLRVTSTRGGRRGNASFPRTTRLSEGGAARPGRLRRRSGPPRTGTLCRRWRARGAVCAGGPRRRSSSATPASTSPATSGGSTTTGGGQRNFTGLPKGASCGALAELPSRLPRFSRRGRAGRGRRRASALVGLLALWEVANVAGFIAISRWVPPAGPAPAIARRASTTADHRCGLSALYDAAGLGGGADP